MKRVIFTLIVSMSFFSLSFAGRAAEAPDAFSKARSHGLPPLPRMTATSLSPAEVRAFVERQRTLDRREREERTHVHLDSKPPRDVSYVTIVRGDDYLRRRDDEGSVTVSGRTAGVSWVHGANGTNYFPSFTSLAERGAETDEALGETANPHRLIVRRLWAGGEVEIDHFDLDTKDELRQDDFRGIWVSTTFADFTSAGTFRYARQLLTDLDGRKIVEQLDDMKLRSVEPAEVAIPPQRSLFSLAPGTMQTLPAKINNGEIDVRVDLGGQVVDFILDRGTTYSMIDPDVARRAHLEERGNSFVVPTLRIGSYGARNVSLRSAKLDHRVANGTEVGILGGDFFSSFVVGIDYRTPEISLIDPGSFDGTKSEGFALPLSVVDGVPFTTFQIGGNASDRFLLDTGSNIVVATARFARAHSDDVRDRGGENFNRSFHHYYSSYGGGFINTYPAVVDRVQLGPMRFNGSQLQVESFEGPPSPGFADFDGIVGYNLMRFFDLWFDYSRNQVWLAPNGDRSLQRKGS